MNNKRKKNNQGVAVRRTLIENEEIPKTAFWDIVPIGKMKSLKVGVHQA
jgi:hypothetical protein